MKTMQFVSGASGVGKTTLIPHLRALLPDNYSIHDFDERGVPDGADRAWRVQTTQEWIAYGYHKAVNGITVVVCGTVNPDEIESVQEPFSDFLIRTLLLDGREDVIEQRLRKRNLSAHIASDLERVTGSVEGFIQNNTQYIPVLRELYRSYGYPIVDTTKMKSEDVAEQVAAILTRS